VKRVLIAGAGFAGLWSAAGAARKLDSLGIPSGDVEVTVVNRDRWHGIRVRNYETDLTDVRVPLDDVLEPIGVKFVEAEVTGIDAGCRELMIREDGRSRTLSYDRLVFALGSRLNRPPVPGLDSFAFDIDTYGGAARLKSHLAALADRPPTAWRDTVLVIGAGLTGIETAAELAGMPAPHDAGRRLRIILADHAPQVGSDMGVEAQVVIREALDSLGVEMRAGRRISAPKSARRAAGGNHPEGSGLSDMINHRTARRFCR
jgi:NADH:ubiquinone reductase (H+-translocating)